VCSFVFLLTVGRNFVFLKWVNFAILSLSGSQFVAVWVYPHGPLCIAREHSEINLIPKSREMIELIGRMDHTTCINFAHLSVFPIMPYCFICG